MCSSGVVGVHCLNAPQHVRGWLSDDEGCQQQHPQVKATGQGNGHRVEFARFVLNVLHAGQNPIESRTTTLVRGQAGLGGKAAQGDVVAPARSNGLLAGGGARF
jgi:hypothetical protein